MSIISLLNNPQDLYADNIFGKKGLNASKNSDIFGADIARRISNNMGLNANSEAQNSAGSANSANSGSAINTAAGNAEEQQNTSLKLQQLQKLESALSGTVAYMAEKHGQEAGTALMGLVYKRLGDGDINEETLGNAFLDAVRFVDKNFGIEAGDAFMNHLNGSLNQSLNEFFENGLNEQFIAVTSGGSAAPGADIMQNALNELDKDYLDNIKTMLENARAEDANAENDFGSELAGYAKKHNKMLGAVQDILV